MTQVFVVIIHTSPQNLTRPQALTHTYHSALFHFLHGIYPCQILPIHLPTHLLITSPLRPCVSRGPGPRLFCPLSALDMVALDRYFLSL